MEQLSKANKANIHNFVKERFYSEMSKPGSSSDKVFRQLSVLFHPDKCILRDLPIGLKFEETEAAWDWEPSAKLKAEACAELFRQLTDIHDEHNRLSNLLSSENRHDNFKDMPDAQDNFDKDFTPFKEGDKRFVASDIYVDSTGMHYVGEWSCKMCGPGLRMNPTYHPDECARCGTPRGEGGESAVKTTKAEKVVAASNLKFKKSRDHFPTFKRFMKDTHGITINKTSFERYFNNPEYLSEYRDVMEQQDEY